MQDSASMSSDEAAQNRSRVIKQAALVAALIAALLLVLLVLERNQSPEPEPVARMTTRMGPALSAGRVDEEANSSPLPSLAAAAEEALRQSSEAAALERVGMPEPAEAVPEETGAPSLPAPVVQAAPLRNVAGNKALEVAAAPVAAVAPPAAAVAIKPRMLVTAPDQPPSKPADKAASGVLVQVGVFSNANNATQLFERLRAAKIPARIESHVQIGPFKNKEEALAAQKKLRAMGLSDGIVLERR